jgi:hypothetical protein
MHAQVIKLKKMQLREAINMEKHEDEADDDDGDEEEEEDGDEEGDEEDDRMIGNCKSRMNVVVLFIKLLKRIARDDYIISSWVCVLKKLISYQSQLQSISQSINQHVKQG